MACPNPASTQLQKSQDCPAIVLDKGQIGDCDSRRVPFSLVMLSSGNTGRHDRTMVTSTFAPVLVLTTSSGTITQYLVAEFSSLQSCETAGRSQAENRRPLQPD
jgi:hypothetical protein